MLKPPYMMRTKLDGKYLYVIRLKNFRDQDTSVDKSEARMSLFRQIRQLIDTIQCELKEFD